MKISNAYKIMTEKDGADDTAIILTMVFYSSDVADILASFDPSSSTSPSAADSRSIARPIAEVLKSVEEGS